MVLETDRCVKSTYVMIIKELRDRTIPRLRSEFQSWKSRLNYHLNTSKLELLNFDLDNNI